MAARRGRGGAAEPPPPPPPEPTPEPEPEKTEEPPQAAPEAEQPALKSSISKDGRVTEKIIERIIICPGMQNNFGPGMMGPPGMGYQGPLPGGRSQPPTLGQCPCLLKNCSKKKSKKKKKGGERGEPCNHPFCIVQRAKTRPQGLPWASGLYPGPSPPPPPPPQPPVVVCQWPVLCCCPRCRPSDDSDSEDEEEDDLQKTDTETFMTFMNLVFAASNVINERPEIL